MNDNTDRVRDALSFLDPGMPRDDWVRIAMALKSGLGEEGFEVFDAWSKGADLYNAKDAQDTFRSCKANGKVTLGTLFYKAKASGWRDDGAHQRPSPEDLEGQRRRSAEQAAQEEAEKVRKHAVASGKARALWEAATPARDDHAYLARKQVAAVATLREVETAGKAKDILGYTPRAEDEPRTGRLLAVPVEVDGQLSSIELIDEAGRKSALCGGKKKGGFWSAQPLPDGDGTGVTVTVGEGVATCLSVREATGGPVIASLCSGNWLPPLRPCARATRRRRS